jgi:carboxyl-terminal processing protease
MRAIMTYVKQNKWKFFSMLILIGGLFFAFNTFKPVNQESPELRHRKLLSTIGQLLESEHYSPRKVDDDFSKEVFDNYLKALDPEKNLFIQADLNAFEKYKTTIDDEIHGADIEFTTAVDLVYEIRTQESTKIFDSIIKQKFDFTSDDSVLLEADSLAYPANERERYDRWYKAIKYKALDKYVSLIEEREKYKTKALAKKDTVGKSKDKYVVKTDAALEVDARLSVEKAYRKRFDVVAKSLKKDKEKRFEIFLNTITGLMDPHTDYFAPVEKRSFTEQMSGVIYGIGAQLGPDDYGVKIASIQPGGPAWKSGQLVINDVITKVGQGNEEPVDIVGYEVTDAVTLIRGTLGSEVRLTIRKPDGTTKVVSLIREKIVLDEGYARSAVITKGADKFGYILLPDFYANFEEEEGAKCSRDVAREVEKLKAEKVKGIIIDVRFNGGGSLYEVVQMAGLFIDKGPIVQIRNREGRSQVLSDEKPGILYNGPLVVMVNEFSASASEIFAGAIQDYKRGLVVGSTSTYGKGTVQRNVAFGKPLDDLGIQTEYGAVKLTFQKFYRVTGSSTQKKGVAPDVVFPDEYEFLKYRERDNPASLQWDEMERAKYQPWSSGNTLAQVASVANRKITSDTGTIKFNKNSQWVSTIMDRPISLNYDKYVQFKKQLLAVVKQNESFLKLKDTMQISALKADYEKFYNNPDKTKQERYQAWLKLVAKDIQINESSKLLNELAKEKVVVRLK